MRISREIVNIPGLLCLKDQKLLKYNYFISHTISTPNSDLSDMCHSYQGDEVRVAEHDDVGSGISSAFLV